MKYLFFDTNIYLDMVTDRNNKINFDLIFKFNLLLKKSEDITIILPEIVSFEVNKHLNLEIEAIGKNIKEQKKEIDKLYWFPYSEVNIEEYKKRVKESLTELQEIYDKNKNEYEVKAHRIIDNIFKNEKTKFIKSDSYLNDKVLTRKIFKKAPLHIESKDSFADALIVETLINLKRYVNLQVNDKIYFVTRNTSDFSCKFNKKELHSDIKEDLKNVALLGNVVYLNDLKEVIGKELKEEIKKAELDVEFEEILEEEERKRLEILELEEENRIAGGLTPLSVYPEHLDIEFSESQEYNEIREIFENINSIILQLNDEIYLKFEDLNDKAEEKDLEKYDKKLFSEITEFSQKLEEEYETLPENLEIGKNIEFKNSKKEKIFLEWKDFELSPDNDSTDTVSLFLKKAEQIIAIGKIEVYYGYLNFNEDGNADDGCAESITIEFDGIISELKEIEEEYQNILDYYSDKYDEFIEKFKEFMNENNEDVEFEYDK